MVRLATLTAGLAAAALAAAPASAHTTTLTKAQVIARGSAICKAGQHKVEALPQIRSQNPFGPNAPQGDRHRAIVFLAGYGDALAGVRAGLAKLDPPVAGRTLFEGFVADLGPTIAMFRRAHGEAVAGHGARAMSDAQAAFGLFAKASVKTRAYGFPKGVCQAGA
jgi:hypothetical protein